MELLIQPCHNQGKLCCGNGGNLETVKVSMPFMRIVFMLNCNSLDLVTLELCVTTTFAEVPTETSACAHKHKRRKTHTVDDL